MSAEKDAELEKVVDGIRAAIEREERVLYSEKVIQEAYNPQNVGRMAKPDSVGVITGPCGDTMEFYLKVTNGQIKEITFMTDGCGATIACGSALTKMVKGRSVDDAYGTTEEDLLNALGGLPEENLHCSKLAIATLRVALDECKKGR
ncbi:MAG: iron-sulfur cluster assembly scaffold protein [Candidatus Thermoplasmatota archaeon]